MLKELMMFLFFVPVTISAQFSIQGLFSPAESYNYVLIYQVTPNAHNYVGNAEIKNGKFHFELDSTNPKGIYKLVYALPQEDYNFDIIYSAEEDIEFSFDQETGVRFVKSSENMLVSSYTRDMNMVNQEIDAYFSKSKSLDRVILRNLFSKKIEIQDIYENNAIETIALSFIKSSKSYVPDSYTTLDDYYKNLKRDYFIHVDFSDVYLQSSNFLIDRISHYIFENDDVKTSDMLKYQNRVDDVYVALKKAKVNTKIALLFQLWQQMVDFGLDATANHISYRYLLNLLNNHGNSELAGLLKNFQNISLGSIAPDFFWQQSNEDTSSKITLKSLNVAKRYIIVFWSSSCSHCQEEIPELRRFLESKSEEKIQVIAVGLEETSFNWSNLILDYPNFIHVLGLGKWTNEIALKYNVSGTPTYFILNEDKEIILKPDSLDELKEYFRY